ncbi:hypothetical protein ILYODFUR_014464 [Ilyodon furcidens]|uniref:Secreted protein n=1 Tax=Ilyodon furcidens TaxID=33524 RepID=A0ABV0TVR0_9TELE
MQLYPCCALIIIASFSHTLTNVFTIIRMLVFIHISLTSLPSIPPCSPARLLSSSEPFVVTLFLLVHAAHICPYAFKVHSHKSSSHTASLVESSPAEAFPPPSHQRVCFHGN